MNVTLIYNIKIQLLRGTEYCSLEFINSGGGILQTMSNTEYVRISSLSGHFQNKLPPPQRSIVFVLYSSSSTSIKIHRGYFWPSYISITKSPIRDSTPHCLPLRCLQFLLQSHLSQGLHPSSSLTFSLFFALAPLVFAD